MVGRSFVVIVLEQDAERRACVRAEINLERGRGHHDYHCSWNNVKKCKTIYKCSTVRSRTYATRANSGSGDCRVVEVSVVGRAGTGRGMSMDGKRWWQSVPRRNGRRPR